MRVSKDGRAGIIAVVARGLLGCGLAAALGAAGTASAQYAGPAELTSPTCGSLLLTGNESFNWDQVNAANYTLWIGTTQGSSDAFKSAKLPGSTTSVTPTSALDVAKRYWVRLRSLNPSTTQWEIRDCTVGPEYTGPAAIADPRCGEMLESRTPTFVWPEVGATAYSLWIGGIQGGSQWYASAKLPAGTNAVTIPPDKALPADGRTLWVRLRSLNPSSNKWQSVDCQVNAVRPDFEPPSPTCGSILTGTNETLRWEANGNPNALEWKLKVGTTVGGTEFLERDWKPEREALVEGIPGDGSFVFTRLQWRKSSGATASSRDCKMLAPTFAPPTLTAPGPVCGGTLPGASATFSWAPGAWQIAKWGLLVGSTPGGSEYFNDEDLTANVNPEVPGQPTSQAVAGLPTDGRLVYVRLRYQPVKIGRWLYHDCVVTASGAPQRPVFVAPACGDVLPGSQTQFDWLPRGTAVDRWQVLAGSTLGGSDYFEGATLEADARTTLVTGLPRDGRQIYVRLRWREAGVWKNTDCLYPGYKSLNFFSEGTAERTTTQTCDTTPTSTGSPMPIANTVGCVDRTCVPPSPPLVPPVPGDLALPRVGFTTKGAPVDDPSVYTGTWALTGNYLSVCDGKRITETLSTGNFAVDQDLVTRAISGKLRTVVVPSLIGCKFDCTAPGQCTLDCPQAQGLRCAVTCTPATDFCDRESTVSGVVAPDGAISMSITHDQVIDYDCGDFGTIHMEDHQGDPENPGDPSNPGLELEFPGPPTRVVN